MSKTQQTDQFDDDLKDELFDFATAADGEVVTAEIVSVEKESKGVGETIFVTARLPTGKTFREWMPYPKGDTTEWKFVRLARSCGYTLGSAEHMIGDEVPCRYTDDEWKTVAPRSRVSTVRSKLTAVLVSLTTPLWVPWGFYRSIKEENPTMNPVEVLVGGGIALMIWTLAIVVGIEIANAIVYVAGQLMGVSL